MREARLKLTESQLSAQVKAYLEILESQGKLFWLRLNAGQFVFEDKDGKRRHYSGVRKGCSDFLILMPGHVIFLELKSTTGKMSEYQKEFANLVNFFGAEYRVAKDFDRVQEILYEI